MMTLNLIAFNYLQNVFFPTDGCVVTILYSLRSKLFGVSDKKNCTKSLTFFFVPKRHIKAIGGRVHSQKRRQFIQEEMEGGEIQKCLIFIDLSRFYLF